MGMFDYIAIDNKWLPKDKQVPYENQEFQTKDFDCELAFYDINHEGQLFRHWFDSDGYENFEPLYYTQEAEFYDFDNTYKAIIQDGMVKEVIDITEA